MPFPNRMILSLVGSLVMGISALQAADFLPLSLPKKRKEPGRLEIPRPSLDSQYATNQQIADHIAAKLRQMGDLKDLQINIYVHAGIVDLTGFVATGRQRDMVILLTQSVEGVTRIQDRLQVRDSRSVVQTQLTEPVLQPGPELGPPPVKQDSNPLFQSKPPKEPTPIFQAAPPSPTPHGYRPPKMPPYAWPTYAPYNNYSRVGYPLSYPYQAWPFIGPIHPFPKVPLGWRSINLTWQDGFWWYGRNSTGYDWWRLRFW